MYIFPTCFPTPIMKARSLNIYIVYFNIENHKKINEFLAHNRYSVKHVQCFLSKIKSLMFVSKLKCSAMTIIQWKSPVFNNQVELCLSLSTYLLSVTERNTDLR